MLEHLEPKAVFHWFEALCAIPHGSGNTRAVADWCVDFAKARGLACRRDGHDNVVIVKEAAPGYEAAPTLILQGHLDMVCEKVPGCGKDMAKEGLDLRCDENWVWAEGTTLGGDDGIAVAMALAILDDDSLPHPRLEVLITADEEIGMLGAEGLDASDLQGRQLLNLDSESEGIFTVGCAGGNRTHCVLPLRREPYEGGVWRLTVSGLRGGHSGECIGLGRGNASMLLGRALGEVARHTELRLILAQGGLKDNAIPSQAEAEIAVPAGTELTDIAAAFEAQLRHEYRAADPDVTVTAVPCEPGFLPMDEASTARCLCLLTCAPNGIQEMSQDVPGLPQTSLNLGILTTVEDTMEASFCLRSSVASQKEMMRRRLDSLTTALGGHTEVSGDYPAWEYRADSALRDRMVAVYRDQYGAEPRIEVIHAGLECGLLSGKLPGLDCVSIGPDLEDIHTPRERMSIPSVQRIWAFVTEVLRRSK